MITGTLQPTTYTADGKPLITLCINERQAVAGLQKLENVLLDVEIKKHSEKRTLSANSYFWQLVDKIKNTRDKSEDEVYQHMLAQYGQNQFKDDGNIATFLLPYGTKLEGEIFTHSAAVKTVELKGQLFTYYRMLRGSSTYTSAEMSVLIDGIVSEAKELDIETLTPNELSAMCERWNK